MTILKNNSSYNRLKSLSWLGAAVLLIGCSNSESKTAAQITDTPATTQQPSKPIATKEAHNDAAPAETSATTRSAESHVHGGAVLSIVPEGAEVAIEFETPIYNLLGFEYAPQTGAEKTRVAEIEKMLAEPQNLIAFNKSAKCSYLSPSPKVELFEHHDDEADHHEDEAELHDDEHHDDEHHDDHDEDAEAGSHKDVILNYKLTCKSPEKLKTIGVEFFNVFSNFTELELVYLGPSKQMSAKLTPSRPNVDLTK